MFRTGDRVVWLDSDGQAFAGMIRDVTLDDDKAPYQFEYKVAGRTFTVWTQAHRLFTFRNWEG